MYVIYKDAMDIAHDIEFNEIIGYPEYVLCKLFTINDNILSVMIDCIIKNNKLKEDIKGELSLIGIHKLLSKGYSIIFFYKKNKGDR